MASGSYGKRNGNWFVRYYDTQGVQRRKGGFRTKGDAEEWYAQRRREQKGGVDHHSDMTLAMLVDDFLATHEASRARLEVLGHRLKYATDAFGSSLVVNLTTGQIARWRRDLPNPSIQYNSFAALKQVLAYGVLVKAIAESPATGIKNPQPKAQEFVTFRDWAEVAELEAEMTGHYRDWPTVLVGTGMRPQEWPKLDIQHVDFEAKVIRMPASIAKTGQARIIPLRQSALSALRRIIGERRSGRVFVTMYGGPVDIRNFRNRIWRPAIDRVNAKREANGLEEMPLLRPYDARHAYATWSLRAGLNTFTLARRMGTSLEMIDRTYGHFATDSEDHERALMDAFDLLASVKTEVMA